MVSKAFNLLHSAKRSGIHISLNNGDLQLKFSKGKKIEPQLLQEIKDNKKLITDFLSNNEWKSKKFEEFENELHHVDRDSIQQIPLSFSQERLWFIHRLEGSVQYHVSSVLRFNGLLNKEALSYALQTIVGRHEVLRTVIREAEGHGYQYVLDQNAWKLDIIDNPGYTEDHEGGQQFIQQLINTPFDLTKDYMLRASLISLHDGAHVLAVTVHHIASDGWSFSIIVKELIELYGSYVEGRPSQLLPLPLQYADYAIWQRKYLQGEVMDKKLGYWKQKLQDVADLQLPADYSRPAVWSTRGAVTSFRINKELSGQLQVLSQQYGTTLFMTLLAAFKVLLHRYTGQQDICVGSAIAGRQHQELEGLIGFFVNSLALRSDVSGNVSFLELLQQVKATTLEAYEHQEVPFETVVDAVVKERDMSRNPLFQVMFVLQNTPEVPQVQLGKLTLLNESFQHTAAKFDITFLLTETPVGLRATVEYCTDLYHEQTITRMMGHFQELLSAIVKQPDEKVGLLPMLTMAEEHQLVVEFNANESLYPKHRGITDLFEEQVSKTPAGTAVVFEGERLSYLQLDERSNQLAHYLRSRGVKEETLVPICIERSLEMIIGILGILKAGGAYVPIDAGYPEERISYMLKDIGCKLVVTTSDYVGVFEKENAEVVCMDRLGDVLRAFSRDKAVNATGPDSLAYVMYTSGSTGKPKGVMVEHRNVVSLVRGIDYVSLSKEDILLSTGSPSFDATTFEYWSMLLNGGQLILCTENKLLDSELLKEEIDSRGVTKMWFTSSWFNQLVETDISVFEGLGTILVGGEKLSEQHIKKLSQTYGDVEIINGYGPTENTTFSLTCKISGLQISGPIPIGRPLSNRRVYVLDEWQRLVPVGVAGELYLGGDGLGRGYLNRPELTAEKFIADPFNKEPGARLYKTGDLGRWLADGNIEYLGRIDDQVKIRGYRIEPGEIESVLNNLEEVSSACVVVNQDQAVTNKLIAYYTPSVEAVKLQELDLYQKRVENWRELYETEYSKAEEISDIDHEFNIVGWNDSFTGKEIPAEQMREWLDDIMNVILSQEPDRVLEIGCGTGLIYYRLAGHIQKYTGIDFSQVSVNQIISQISKGEKKYPPTDLKVGLAHEIKLEAGQEVDMIILNSIVQYFPGEKYLTDVLAKSISVLKGYGRIVIGDIRDNRLLKLFRSRLSLKKSKEDLSIGDFIWSVEQEVSREEELCVSPEYFYHLRSLFPEITHIDIQWKQAEYINELTLYRYTVTIYVGINNELMQPDWRSWDDITAKDIIIEQLNNGCTSIAIKDIPNPRFSKEILLEKGLKDKSISTVRGLSDYIAKEYEEGTIINEIISVAKSKSYQYRLLLNEDPLKINLFLHLGSYNCFVKQPYNEGDDLAKSITANVPLLRDIYTILKKDIYESLKEQLPDYMIPAELIAVPYLPLTSNGKVDRNFLKKCGEMHQSISLNYQAPVTLIEQQLATIWQELLGLEAVGIHDNFFELGGDSIITIQVVSRVKRLGYSLKPKDLFINQTVADLSIAISEHKKAKSDILGEQGRLTGVCRLLPIQQWYFEKESADVSHFNQSILLGLDKAVSEQALSRAFEQLTVHHDALRFKYFKSEGSWQQVYGSYKGGVIAVDLRSASEDSLRHLITEHAGLHQRGLDIEKGELIRVVWIQTPEAEPANRLLIVIHHLAIDGVSWRILLEDLEILLDASGKGQKADLGLKSSSVRQWYDALEKYGHSKTLLSQIDYWQQSVKNYYSLPVDNNYQGVIKVSDTRHHMVRLGTGHTQQLLQEVPRAYHTEINDILLGALARTLCEWSGRDNIIIGLEGHGREAIEEGTDTSRTVGWFTSLYPLLLNVGAGQGEGDLIKSVKEQLRRVPDKGLGYGVLKYINKEGSLQGKQSWEIVFNYLGQLDNVIREGKWLKGTGESTGANTSGNHAVSEKISVNGFIQGGQLVLSWSYSSLHYLEETVNRLESDYLYNLESLIAHCIEQQRSGVVYTPSDYGLSARVTYQELDRFLEREEDNIDNIMSF
ncbi:MAG: amino acid adenylation domain-containing protein [Chitinophagaceae bacterium]